MKERIGGRRKDRKGRGKTGGEEGREQETGREEEGQEGRREDRRRGGEGGGDRKGGGRTGREEET